MEQLNTETLKAARSAAYQWPGVVDADDLAQELSVWVLESPSVQKRLAKGSPSRRHGLLVRQAHKVASAEHARTQVFTGNIEYSLDDVRALLTGEVVDPDRVNALQAGMDRLRAAAPVYAEAIEQRYGRRSPAGDDAERQRVSRAVVRLADLMNASAREEYDDYHDGPGSRRAVSNSAAQTALRKEN